MVDVRQYQQWKWRGKTKMEESQCVLKDECHLRKFLQLYFSLNDNLNFLIECTGTVILISGCKLPEDLNNLIQTRI